MEKIRMRKTLAILISGKAGVGKSTAAYILHKYLQDRHAIKVDIFNFAKGVKGSARFMGWDGQKDEKGRRLLQRIGQAGREYDENLWVEKTFYEEVEMNSLYPFDVILIDDWRFPNEAEFISKSPLYEVVKLRIESPDRECLKGTTEYNEESENSLPSSYPYKCNVDYYNYTILNNGTKEDYTEQLKVFWEYILESKREIIKWKS